MMVAISGMVRTVLLGISDVTVGGPSVRSETLIVVAEAQFSASAAVTQASVALQICMNPSFLGSLVVVIISQFSGPRLKPIRTFRRSKNDRNSDLCSRMPFLLLRIDSSK